MIDLDNADFTGLTLGYSLENGVYSCIYCGERFESGEIYALDGRFYEPWRAVRVHINSAHPDRLELLINHPRQTLTDNQKELLRLFHAGLSDKEIAGRLGVSPSTVRHQRFMFREKAKTARLFLAAWEIAGDNKGLLPVHKGAVMVDERYVITEEESKKILENVFISLDPPRLKVFSSKEKKKIVTLRFLAELFERGRNYAEKEVNAILKNVFEDFATLRRYLIEYGYMERTSDCKSYWRK